MKKALKKLWANAQLLTIGFMVNSIVQLLDYSHVVQEKNIYKKKKMQAPKHSFAIGRIVDQNKVSSNSTFLH